MKFMATRKTDTTYKELNEYVGSWSFPKTHGDMMHLFSDSAIFNNRKCAKFTSCSSEFLTLVPVFLRYLTMVVRYEGLACRK